MDVLYAAEKLSNAVHALAVGPGDIKSRLRDAFTELVSLSERDLPEKLRADLRWIKNELTKKEATSRAVIEGEIRIGLEGRIGATLRGMRTKRAVEVAEKICYLADRLESFVAAR